MKKRSKKTVRLSLPVVPFASCCYIDWIEWLGMVLKTRPRKLRIDIAGNGEIPADAALSIRRVLVDRPRKTRLVTNARSSLQGGSVLIWLLGDRRKIRDDAKVFFRRVDETGIREVRPDEKWTGEDSAFLDSYSQADPDEGDHARVLELIDEFLPVREMAGRLVGVEVLRQFGLVDHKRVDRALASAFRKGAKKRSKSAAASSAGGSGIDRSKAAQD